MTKLIECVPNFSEGRDRGIIDAITGEIAKVAGATLLDVDPGEATNRTVVTFVATPEALVEAAFSAIRKAAELIDMRRHSGAHARQGATDVCPFVPVCGVTVEECVELANKLAARVGEELRIPVYLYELAATRPERRSLSEIRVGEYEALAEKLKKPEWKPDHGPAEFSATAGATVIGVRPFLIAYNINLNTRDTSLAKDIALTIRERGRAKRDAAGKKMRDAEGNLVREPGFPNCRATGWFIEEYGRAQVTMNLTDYTVTPVHVVFDRVVQLATELGVRVTGSEIVGLVPKEAMLQAGRHYLRKQGQTTGVNEQELIDIAVLSLGLAEVAPFEPAQKIIEYQVAQQRRLASMTVTGFDDELASSSPAPGGGSVAALAASMAAGLSSMVAALTFGKKGYTEHNERMEQIGVAAQALKDRLLAAMDDDTAAFDRVMACFRLPKGTDQEKAARQAAIEAATKEATLIPLSVLEACPEILELVGDLEAHGNQNSLSDAGVGGLMARAGAYGAYYNVLINLKGIEDKPWCDKVRAAADAALARTDELGQRVQQAVLVKLREA
jgi:glutamate formiminotransferase/formiminotetrahydrofolate cyclodeaminase